MDSQNLIARVTKLAGGALLGDVDRETALYNLCVPLGHAPVTGMVRLRLPVCL